MDLDIAWWIGVPILSYSFNIVLFLFLKHYGVNWFCKQFFADLVCVEDTQGNGDNRKHITKGDKSSISAELVGCVIPGLNGVVGLLVMIETGYDTVNAKSAIFVPWCHIGAWYLIADLYTMYDTQCERRNLYHLPLAQRIIHSLRPKSLYVFHHIFSFLFGYIVIVNTSFRHGKIDFYFASILLEELCNPFICFAKIMRVMGQAKSPYYMVNGFLLTFSYFIFRIINQPLVLLAYVAQYHNWNFMRAAASLRLVCYFTFIIQYSFQVYWFSAILGLVIKGLKEKYFTDKSKTQ